MMRRLALVLASLSLAWVPLSLAFSGIGLTLGGRTVLPMALLTIAVDGMVVGINMVTLTLVSPDNDTFHYPRRLGRRVAGLLARCLWAIPAAWRSYRQHRRDGQDMAAQMARPTRRAWDMIAYPPHGTSDARRSRIEGLRFRSDIVVDRLTGSIDVADIDAIVLLDKTLGEVSSTYREALTVVTTDKGRKAIDRSLEETIERMVSAAESRLAVSDHAVTDRFDAAIRHAQASSARLADR